MLINKNIFNVSEAAFILGLSASTIYKFIHTGVIKAFKYDNRYAWYITADELQRYLNTCQQKTLSTPTQRH